MSSPTPWPVPCRYQSRRPAASKTSRHTASTSRAATPARTACEPGELGLEHEVVDLAAAPATGRRPRSCASCRSGSRRRGRRRRSRRCRPRRCAACPARGAGGPRCRDRTPRSCRSSARRHRGGASGARARRGRRPRSARRRASVRRRRGRRRRCAPPRRCARSPRRPSRGARLRRGRRSARCRSRRRATSTPRG